MITFIASILLLLAGYFVYGRIVERVFGADARRDMPCNTMCDGIDYTPLPAWRIFLIQFLNITGTGPIFGAILGVLYGPAAYIWIVVGSIFIGAMHDYMSGMMSVRMGGASAPELINHTLGRSVGGVVRIVTLFLLIMVAAVFVSTPATLLSQVTTNWGFFGTETFWTIAIFVYFLLATLLPIGTLIGRIYPVFGVAILVMAIGVGIGLFTQDGDVMEITNQPFVSHHPRGISLFPMLCITIACGAISGFHATQSPMMARCMQNERLGRRVFYGSMIAEGIVALIWAAAAIKFSGNTDGLLARMTAEGGKLDPALIVNAICSTWMGKVGAILALLGVVAAPITTGDTALRSARLIVADALHWSQDKIVKRLIVAVPLAVIVFLLLNVDFNILWQYFGWINQTLAMFTLWAITVWLARDKRCYYISLLPAIFMTITCVSFILVCPAKQGGFELPIHVGIIAGATIATICTALFYKKITLKTKL